jgi:hypothetical protein
MNNASRIANASWETINMKVLKRLPVYNSPSTCWLQKDMGNGCAGDPPGYPTYFTRSVYTQYGNSPRRGPQYVIAMHIVDAGYGDKREALMRRLWLPLPLEHPRTQAWIADRFKHLHTCYLNPALSGREQWNEMVFYPVPKWQLKGFTDDERFSDEWRAKEMAAIDQANEEIIRHARKFANHDNHAAVISIREYYPEFKPTNDQINGCVQTVGNWWETMAARPTPETCPGQYGTEHPVNGSWCQMCGYKTK